ncbi:hypothetical protein HYC85_009651 [Camellia sinensis]|uniref:Uncharacterized protein n=1 Tax=Camellia sinensis TaxID=4442 RepID=A0A7J7HGZ6_CAMSI|nr:hypothetical protein HYC85_009651 [Camellia sinensis]
MSSTASVYSGYIGSVWNDKPLTVLPIIQKQMASGISVWIYSGDTDGVVPVTITKYGIDKLQTSVKTKWYPWYLQGEVGGCAVGYENLTFVKDSFGKMIFVGRLDSGVTDEDLRQNNAEDALERLNGTVIGKQTVRLSWGRSPGNKQGQAPIGSRIVLAIKEKHPHGSKLGAIYSASALQLVTKRAVWSENYPHNLAPSVGKKEE